LLGPNAVGLDRAGFDQDTKLEIQHAFRLLFNSDMTTGEAADTLRARSGHVPEIAQLLDFIGTSERGVLV
jgi:UDP-N-acetylglucosamine acyltransferase